MITFTYHQRKKMRFSTSTIGLNYKFQPKSVVVSNHLGNVLTVVSDRKLAHTTTPTSGIIDYYTSEILSSSDGYVFHQTMPNRSYNSNSYRYGLSNGQEKDNEIFEGAFTAEFWEYDSRTGRRWNVDPVDLHIQSVYVCFNNNPIYYSDPLGLYGSKRKAERMRARAEKAGVDVDGEVFYDHKTDEWAFATKEVDKNNDGTVDIINKIHTEGRFFGSSASKIGQFIMDINPFKNCNIYAGAIIKTEISKGKLKGVVPYGGGQLQYHTENGGSADRIDASSSYGNVKVGLVDTRIYPLNGVGGDYDPGIRVLYQLGKPKPIVIPVYGRPVPIGEWKIQGDLQGSFNKTLIGARVAAETWSIPTFRSGDGIKLELNGGVKFELKVPDIFQ